MMYFDNNDQLALNYNNSALRIQDRLSQLNRELHHIMRNYGLNLYPDWNRSTSRESIVGLSERDIVALHYLRGRGEAQAVETMMGRDLQDDLDVSRHPAIEIRVTPDNFAIELVIAPSAWVDQQNLVGKLSIERHRTAFYDLLRLLDPDMVMGFWQGTHLSELHLRTGSLSHVKIFNAWMNTFAEGQDCVRIGAWYSIDDEALSEENMLQEVFRRVSALYKLYTFVAWTSDNDFRGVYNKLIARTA